ncbi:MAG: 30S ribosomal protein S24e [Candidatus Methanoperedens sp.]|nr:30S ribosomal protein S24e [Candidatus Methanoperedens sp.]MCE8425984.1 30S ribosomal protein S24e [Candidatus Methanoperedens sp.]MCE8428203.1 30S ribosomal protein S24e [Candidatus Methanoperedens sp.]
MELQIIQDKTNPLLKKREILIKINNKGTPSRIDIKNKLAAMANSKPELIVIEHLDTVFGKQEVIGTVSVYQNEERLKQLVHQHLLARGAPKQSEEKPAEAATAVTAAPAPAKE